MIDRLYRADEETKAQGSRNRLDFKTPAGAAHRWGQLEVTPEEPGLSVTSLFPSHQPWVLSWASFAKKFPPRLMWAVEPCGSQTFSSELALITGCPR